MAREIIPIIGISSYNPDRGGNIDRLGSRFAKPADLSNATVDQILDVLSLRRKTPADTTPCPNAGEFTARKLVFTRADGNSFSLPLRNKDFAIQLGIAVRNLVNAAVAANPVICVALQGEQWDNLLPSLRTATGAPTPGTPSRSTQQGKQAVHAGKINYAYDAGSGAIVPISVKVDTDLVTTASTSNIPGVTSPPTVLGGAWTGCVGPFELENPCPSLASLSHRRYIGTFLVGVSPNTFYQKTEIPVRRFDTPDILQCGQNLANLPAIVCLAYEGESNSRLHNLFP